MSPIDTAPDLSVIVPVYNEAAGLTLFWERMAATLEQMPQIRAEVLFVDDGSSDDSVARLLSLAGTDARIRVLELSRNFGKEAAMTAGLDFCQGQRVLIIDADLQDPPELLPRMWSLADEGYDVVVPRRTSRPGETRRKVLFSRAFYWLMEHIHAGVRLTPGTGDFRLLSARAVQAIRALREQNRFMKGIFEWVGYPRVLLDYEREPRARGSTKFNFFKLLHLAADGVAAFSTAPLKFATLAGVGAAGMAFLFGSYVIGKTLLFGDPVAGYPTLVTVILFFSGIQLLSIGVLGEYIGRIYNETKGRPLYICKQRDDQA
ncbi:MAG: glycosyltransferase family 2 protein [Oceanococcaceae bacterium]